jgi:beta-glucanase (GH16 family)
MLLKFALSFVITFSLLAKVAVSFAQVANPFKPDSLVKHSWDDYHLVWNDEFDYDGAPSASSWGYELGFVRNNELQWYQPNNARCSKGLLTIEAKREFFANPGFDSSSSDWRKCRKMVDISSASIKTAGHREFTYGRFAIRARIDTSMGAWPAIWTLGRDMEWPSCGEVDLLEYYLVNGAPSVLANVASGTSKRWNAKWNSKVIPLSSFSAKDREWASKFHVWRMDWTPDYIKLYIDDELVNTTFLKDTVNPDGSQPFSQPHYILLNLAIGANGGNPDLSKLPIRFEVDYVRVYQR